MNDDHLLPDETTTPTAGEREAATPKHQPPPPPPPPLKRARLDEQFSRGDMANLNGCLVVVHKVTAKELVLRSVPVPPGFVAPVAE